MSDLGDIATSIGKFVAAVLAAGPSSRTWISESVGDDLMIPTSVLGPAIDAPHISMAERAQQQIAELQKIDPDFNELQFLGQAASQYGAALAAESSMNPDAFTGIATPDFITWFRNRVTDWNNAGLRCVIKDLKLSGSTILRVALDGTSQAIVVRFVGTATRFTQDTESGVAVDGDALADSFTEFATFVRPTGTTTPKSAATGGAIHCPSCGAPTVAGAARCPFCGSQLTGTGSTWLLDKLSASAYT